MTLESEFPPDERVEKEIASLLKAGFEVCIATYTFGGRPAEERLNGFTVYRKKISRWLYKSSAASLILPFYFRYWEKYLNDILSRERFDVIHVHDLPLSRTAHRLALRHHLRLVCDQHEYYSNWIVRTRHYNTFTGKIIRRLSDWVSFEKKNLTVADRVITVSYMLRDIYIRDLGLSAEKVINLPNTTELSVFTPENIDPAVPAGYAGRFVLFYAGGLDPLRGIEFICEAVAMLKQHMPEVLFLVLGKENRSFSMEEMINRYDIRNHVDFVGWVPRNRIASYLAAAGVCLFLPRADNDEIHNTIVTKIYQYTAMGKPIVVSEARMMKAFVEENGLGFSVPYGDVEGLCAMIRKIHDDPGLVAAIASRAHEVLPRISWEETSRDFVNCYLEMNGQHA